MGEDKLYGRPPWLPTHSARNQLLSARSQLLSIRGEVLQSHCRLLRSHDQLLLSHEDVLRSRTALIVIMSVVGVLPQSLSLFEICPDTPG